MKLYRTHLTSFAGVLGFEVSRYFAINDRACLTRLFFARTGIKPGDFSSAWTSQGIRRRRDPW
ncbi:MAG: hypothetical protein KME25_10160 [Symplocastrum torsivum CPER-KK1]|uniref:Uncharacterized protein n=1 Tax=Symplocastrum torsivum CPER-KK1 TaxID=450513 RepID=A0A951PKD4_9CYAN|nr:hypothetical protein [Microcoleus sp. FACHB-SPT15]MBW4544789.1 hypothetical protein [Symplocastrum torsivum CPER-KK1]